MNSQDLRPAKKKTRAWKHNDDWSLFEAKIVMRDKQGEMEFEVGGKSTNNNCLNLIRIIAAFQVIFGHSVEHLELPINNSFFHLTYFFRGVPIFFIISGFLIWFSMARSNNYGSYLRKRFLRIYPELWVSVGVEIVVIIVIYHGWKLEELLLFVLGQATVFQFWTPDSLRGYGVGTPNGALWTIGVMIQFYIVAWFFYLFMKSKKCWFWIVGLIVSFAISFLGNLLTHDQIDMEIIGKLYDQSLIKYFWLFYIGMFIAYFWDKFMPVLKKIWWGMLLLAVFFFGTGLDLYSGYYLFWSLFLTLGLIGFSYSFPNLSINPDVSYGLFLYHMTIVNILVSLGCVGNWMYLLLVVVGTVLIAYISTITVGKLSSNIKNIKLYK